MKTTSITGIHYTLSLVAVDMRRPTRKTLPKGSFCTCWNTEHLSGLIH
jgi:hypothetical protein